VALVFRLMFLSGVTKLASGDPTWRHLTALDFHFWTQPLPTGPAWYAHWLPEWVHRVMTLAIIAIELLVPWLIFVPERWAGRWSRVARHGACALLVLGQLAIALTGNYGFFNLLAIVLCVALLDDAALQRVLPLRLAAGDPEPRWKLYAIRGVRTAARAARRAGLRARDRTDAARPARRRGRSPTRCSTRWRRCAR